jgi:hypothetical protein
MWTQPKGALLRLAGLGRKTLGICLPLFPALVLCLFCLTFRVANAQTDVSVIIQKSLEANKRDEEALPNYDYREEDSGAHGTKTYAVTMIEGSPYERLIAVNGQELTGSQKEDEQTKFEEEVAQRRAESPHKRAQRIAKYKAARRRDNNIMAQLTEAFDFKMEGKQQLGNHSVYVLKATPRQGYRPPNRDCQVLPGMEGTLWIDEQTFQWVKVEAHVTRPVSIEGFVAVVEPGTKFELEKAPVEGNIWLPTHYAMTASARVFRVIPHHSQENDKFSDYHRRETSSGTSAPKSKGLSR